MKCASPVSNNHYHNCHYLEDSLCQIPSRKDSIVPDTGLKLSVKLKEVSIIGFRNTKLDSINNRKAFANDFADKAPGITDLFSQKVTLKNDYSAFQPSTSSIDGIIC